MKGRWGLFFNALGWLIMAWLIEGVLWLTIPDAVPWSFIKVVNYALLACFVILIVEVIFSKRSVR